MVAVNRDMADAQVWDWVCFGLIDLKELHITIVGRAGSLIALAERIGPDHHILIANHHVEIIGSTTPTAGDDAADAAWVPLDQLTEIELVPGLLDYLRDNGIVS